MLTGKLHFHILKNETRFLFLTIGKHKLKIDQRSKEDNALLKAHFLKKFAYLKKIKFTTNQQNARNLD
jgi:hypothetical protein